MTKLIALIFAAIATLGFGPSAAAHAAPAPSGKVILVDGYASAEVTTAESAWSQRTNVNLQATNSCTGPGCIHIALVDTTPCMSGGMTMGMIAGCSFGDADGSCTSDISSIDLQYGTNAVRAAIEHEIGHCLGLGHSTDKRSIMQAYIDPYNPPKGPDSNDRANVRALYPPT